MKFSNLLLMKQKIAPKPWDKTIRGIIITQLCEHSRDRRQ